ncbi:3-hydroxyacyl-CoA dehydrogenase NAD-binding domain-containing protein [Anaerovoracaceae bacterium 42-11]|nr:3-hydroxyacyl-CoA dehydrogenase NAD-binding domain-containing protein [Emergencia sp.]
MKDKKKVAVLGAGTMGTGIGQTFAMAGCDVTLICMYDDMTRSKPMETMESNLKVLAENEALDLARIPEILARVSLTESMEEGARDADIIFECVVEDLAVKQDYFAKLDALCPPETILATNTSVISVTEIAEKSVHKERIIGTHFWNPAYLVPLVEVIKTKYVSDAVVEETYELLEKAKKCPVIVQKDVPGFLANRMQHALFREAISIVERGIATAEDVDKAIKYGFGMRLGVRAPMEVIDAGGTDLTYNIHEYLFPHIENSTEPSKLLKEKLAEGKLGFKSGEGFMKWSKEEIEKSQKDLIEGLIKVARALDRL